MITTLVAVHYFEINNAAAMEPIPSVTINGTYQDNHAGFSVELPEDWSGYMDYLPMFNEDLLLFGGESKGYASPVDSPAVLKIATWNKGAIEISKHSKMMQKDSILDNVACLTLSENFTTVNNATGKEFTKKCETTNKFIKLKQFLFSTKNDSLIELSYIGPFTNQSDMHYDQFISSVNTLKIFNPVDIRNSQIYNDLKYVVNFDCQICQENIRGALNILMY